MTAASALVTGLEVNPQLAEDAVRQALARAGLARANGVVLLLSRDFGRQANHAVLAAARAGGCLQVVGATAHGLFTEAGWVLDQPAAAALVLGGNFALSPSGDGMALSFADSSSLPLDWLLARRRVGLLHSGGHAWQQARVSADGRAEATVIGAVCDVAVSPGMKPLGEPSRVAATRGYDLQRVEETTAVDSLLRLLPPELRNREPLPIHQIAALPEGRVDIPAVPLLSANSDGSITLAQPLTVGQRVQWALRQPLAAENDMRHAMAEALHADRQPAFAVQLSCIGRGPLFYGSDDRDLSVWREFFPGVPLIGAYGSGQLAPGGEVNQQWHNAVVTALFSHV